MDQDFKFYIGLIVSLAALSAQLMGWTNRTLGRVLFGAALWIGFWLILSSQNARELLPTTGLWAFAVQWPGAVSFIFVVVLYLFLIVVAQKASPLSADTPHGLLIEEASRPNILEGENLEHTYLVVDNNSAPPVHKARISCVIDRKRYKLMWKTHEGGFTEERTIRIRERAVAQLIIRVVKDQKSVQAYGVRIGREYAYVTDKQFLERRTVACLLNHGADYKVDVTISFEGGKTRKSFWLRLPKEGEWPTHLQPA